MSKCRTPDLNGSDCVERIDQVEETKSFEKELEALINVHSIENESNTPDFILAQYLRSCLDAFTVATKRREEMCDYVKPEQDAPSNETN